MQTFKKILVVLLLATGLVVGTLALVKIQRGEEVLVWTAVMVAGGLLVVGGIALGIALTGNPARWGYTYLGTLGLFAVFLGMHHGDLSALTRGIIIVVGCVVALLAFPRLSPNPGGTTLGCLVLLPVFLVFALIVTGQSRTFPFGQINPHVAELAIALFGAAIVYWGRRRSSGSFRTLGDRLGFSFQFQKDERGRKQPSLEGRHAGREVRLGFRKHKSGKSRLTCCAMTTPIKSGIKLILRVRPKSQLSQRWRDSELQPVEFDDEDFDPTFLVQSNAPAAAKALLMAETRAALLATRPRPRREISRERLARHPILRRNSLLLDIENGEVSLAFIGSSANTTKLDALATRLDLLCRLADQVEQF